MNSQRDTIYVKEIKRKAKPISRMGNGSIY
jgi:hypothetical protein